VSFVVLGASGVFDADAAGAFGAMNPAERRAQSSFDDACFSTARTSDCQRLHRVEQRASDRRCVIFFDHVAGEAQGIAFAPNPTFRIVGDISHSIVDDACLFEHQIPVANAKTAGKTAVTVICRDKFDPEARGIGRETHRRVCDLIIFCDRLRNRMRPSIRQPSRVRVNMIASARSGKGAKSFIQKNSIFSEGRCRVKRTSNGLDLREFPLFKRSGPFLAFHIARDDVGGGAGYQLTLGDCNDAQDGPRNK